MSKPEVRASTRTYGLYVGQQPTCRGLSNSSLSSADWHFAAIFAQVPSSSEVLGLGTDDEPQLTSGYMVMQWMVAGERR